MRFEFAVRTAYLSCVACLSTWLAICWVYRGVHQYSPRTPAMRAGCGMVSNRRLISNKLSVQTLTGGRMGDRVFGLWEWARRRGCCWRPPWLRVRCRDRWRGTRMPRSLVKLEASTGLNRASLTTLVLRVGYLQLLHHLLERFFRPRLGLAEAPRCSASWPIERQRFGGRRKAVSAQSSVRRALPACRYIPWHDPQPKSRQSPVSQVNLPSHVKTL